MLKRLFIENYALIDSLDITFEKGLNIITGETGAGKSILLGAISLLLGSKSDISVLKDHSRNCIVEAEFDLPDGIVEEFESPLVLRRVLSPNGRSRSFLNDEPVTLQFLTSISTKIVDIHAQHQHLLLSEEDFQMSVLDHYSSNSDILDAYKVSYDDYLEKKRKLTELTGRISELEKSAEYNNHLYRQLEEAHLKNEGEMEELEQLQMELANAKDIKEAVLGVVNIFSEQDYPLLQQLKDSIANLQRISKFSDKVEGLAGRINECKIELSDIESELIDFSERINHSPDKLLEVEERLSLLYTLLKRHNVQTLAELIDIRDTLLKSIEGTYDLELEKAELKRTMESADAKRIEFASELHKRRVLGSDKLSGELQSRIRSLEMPHAIFKVEVTANEELKTNGMDSVKFLFSANGSGRLNELSKAASGGELSRIMLALKSLIAKFTTLPTMIFDEIDTGVSGSIADKMGDLIGDLGNDMQIFAITHLPQIASKKGTHFRVYKIFDADNNAATNIVKLSDNDRVTELARMLSGAELTNAAIENAKVLLKY